MDLSSIISLVSFVTETLPFLVGLVPDVVASSQGDLEAGANVATSLFSSEQTPALLGLSSVLSSN